jgi:CBS domain-containing protein
MLSFFRQTRTVQIDDINLNRSANILDIANKNPPICELRTTIKDLLQMVFNKNRRILVTEGSKLVGILSSIDILEFLEKNNVEHTAEELMIKNVLMIDASYTIEEAIVFLKSSLRGTAPIVSHGILAGMIEDKDITKYIKTPIGIQVAEVMTQKPIFVRSDQTFYEVSKVMSRGKIRRLPILEGEDIVGIVTPTDMLWHLTKNNYPEITKMTTQVKEIMNKRVLCVKKDVDIFAAIDIMNGHQVGGLPVIEDNRMVGIVTERDILNLLV